MLYLLCCSSLSAAAGWFWECFSHRLSEVQICHLPGCGQARLWAVPGTDGDRGGSTDLTCRLADGQMDVWTRKAAFLGKAGLLKPEKTIVKKPLGVFTKIRQPGSPLEQLTEEMYNSAFRQQVMRCLHTPKLGSVLLYPKDILYLPALLWLAHLSDSGVV